MVYTHTGGLQVLFSTYAPHLLSPTFFTHTFAGSHPHTACCFPLSHTPILCSTAALGTHTCFPRTPTSYSILLICSRISACLPVGSSFCAHTFTLHAHHHLLTTTSLAFAHTPSSVSPYLFMGQKFFIFAGGVFLGFAAWQNFGLLPRKLSPFLFNLHVSLRAVGEAAPLLLSLTLPLLCLTLLHYHRLLLHFPTFLTAGAPHTHYLPHAFPIYICVVCGFLSVSPSALHMLCAFSCSNMYVIKFNKLCLSSHITYA